MIEVKNIFENISMDNDISEKKFLRFLNNTLNEIASELPLKSKANLSKIFSVTDNINLDFRYEGPITDNIMYQITNNVDFKSEFLRKLDNVNKAIWMENCKGRRIKG
jgi:hypothetical protein